MWEHALSIRLCQCPPVGVCHLPLCLVLHMCTCVSVVLLHMSQQATAVATYVMYTLHSVDLLFNILWHVSVHVYMYEHALGIRLCQCLPVGVCHLPLCLVLYQT